MTSTYLRASLCVMVKVRYSSTGYSKYHHEHEVRQERAVGILTVGCEYVWNSLEALTQRCVSSSLSLSTLPFELSVKRCIIFFTYVNGISSNLLHSGVLY